MTLTVNSLPAYAYVQYNSDDNINAFFDAYNQLSQENLNTINSLQLPIFLNQNGALLDWCAAGIYGIFRQPLSSGTERPVGPLNTYEMNEQRLDEYELITSATTYNPSDIVFQRIVQWNTFKGDGYQFSVRWLKRRVERFLSGQIFPDQTYQVSVQFVGENSVNIVLYPSVRKLVTSADYNVPNYNQLGASFNYAKTESANPTPMAYAADLQAAVQSGVLLLPFQYTFQVVIL
jgi:hypothetical protein